MTENEKPGGLGRRDFLRGAASAIALGAGGSLLASCGGGTTLGGKAPAKGNATKGNLQWWTNLGAELGGPIKPALKIFEEKYPGIQVNWLDIGDVTQYYTKLKTAGVAKTLPDVFYVRTYDTESNASKGWQAPLDHYMASDHMTTADFWPAMTAQMTYKGKLWTLPYDFSDHVLYYNKNMFAEAGIPLPTGNWTWDEFYQVASKFVVKSGNSVKRWGATIPTYDWFMMGVIKAYGGNTFSADGKRCVISNPAAVKALTDIQEQMKASTLPLPGATPEGLDAFGSAACAMKIDGSWATGFTHDTIGKKFDWDITLMPKGPTGKRAVSTAGGAWGISANSTQQDAAWTFIKFMTSTNMQNKVNGPQGSVPGRKSAVKGWLDLLGSTKPPSNLSAVTQELEPNNAVNWSYPTYYSSFVTIWANLSQSIFNGSDPSTILKEVQSQTNQAAGTI